MSMKAITPLNQVRHTNVATVRMTKGGIHFEIACYRNKVISWRNKIESDLGEVLQVDSVFTNVSQGMLASKKDLLSAFGSADLEVAIRHILDHGELQISEQERESLQESMFRDVAAIVVDKAVNPENNRPYTLSMIQNAMKDIHYSVSTTKGAKSQALDVIRRLKAVMPIARAKMKVRLECPNSLWKTVCAAIEDENLGMDLGTVKSGSIGMEGTVFGSSSSIAGGISGAGTSDERACALDFLIDPEVYRPLQLIMERICGTKGFVQVLQLNASTGAVAAVAVSADSKAETGAAASNTAPQGGDPSTESDGAAAGLNNDLLQQLHTGTNKASKRDKRAAKEAQMAKEAEAALVKARLEREQERARKEAAVVVAASSSEDTLSLSSAAPIAAPAGELKACNTCGGAFDAAGYRAHFRSEWHRFNLKTKLKGNNPLDEATFLALSVEELALVHS